MNSQLAAYLDWLEMRGLRHAAFSRPNLVSPSIVRSRSDIEPPAKGVVLYSHFPMTDSERSLLHRIQKFLQNHFQTVEVLERTGPADEVVLQEARASNAHIILFQLQPSDAFAVNISPQANVLVTAAPRFLLSNPALKRRLWDQMQQFLGIHL